MSRWGRRARALALCGPLAAVALCALPVETRAQGRYQPQGAAQRSFERGEKALRAGEAEERAGDTKDAQAEYREAHTAFAAAVEADPDFADAAVRLGEVAWRLSDPKAALPMLLLARGRHPKNADLRFWLAQNLLLADRPAEALPLLEALVTEAPDTWPEALLALGNQHYKAQDFGAAAARFGQYLQRRPDAVEVRARLGNAWFNLGDYPQALAAFDTVRKARPDDVKVLVNLGGTHARMGDHAAAVAVLEAALKQEPGRESTRFNLGFSLFKLNRHAEAEAHLLAFAQASPEDFNGRYYLGSVRFELGRWADALPELEAAATLDPRQAQPPYKAGLCLMHLGRLPEAQRALAKAQALRPDDAWVASALGTVARKSNDLPTAVAEHQRAAKLAPDKARLQANLALTLLAAKDSAGARGAIEVALKLGPPDTWVARAAARVLAAEARSLAGAGQLIPAVAVLDRALKLLPDDPVLRADRALLKAQTGEAAAAATDAGGAVHLIEHPEPVSGPIDAEALGVAEATRAVLGAQRALAHFALGFAQLSAGKAAEAQPLLDEATSLALPVVVATQGLARLRAGNVAEAITVLDAAAGSGPAPPVLANARGQAHLARALNGFGKAPRQARDLADVRVALAADLSPLDAARAHYLAAILALRAGDGGTARGHLSSLANLARGAGGEAAVLHDAPRHHLDTLRALANLQSGKLQMAQQILAAVGADQRPDSPEFALWQRLHQRQAEQAFARDDLSAAAAALKAIGGAEGADPEVRLNRAVIAWRQGDKVNAEKTFQALASRVPEAGFNLGVALEAKGDHRGAWAAFAAYGKLNRPHSAQARTLAEAKARVFGYGEAP